MATELLMVFCTYPALATENQTKDLETLINKILHGNYAACVNRIPNVSSAFIWQEKLENSKEELLIIKTTKQKYALLEDLITKEHPYDCPEIIAVPVATGNKEYIEWVEQQTSKDDS